MARNTSPQKLDADEGHGGGPAPASRSIAQRSRDRLLYSDEFERLRGVTQVLSPTEGVLCHDRHTHSLRVEQLAVRIAQRWLPTSVPRGAPAMTPCADTVAAAALAHDLGHPPFGHVAESELDELLRKSVLSDADGYEGNAQSFRIITKLATHDDAAIPGLGLSRGALAATLKYPWLARAIPAQLLAGGKRKYGAYDVDRAEFAWVTGKTQRAPRTLEAAIMDVADSITYSLHDLSDFYRAGLIDVGRAAEAKEIELAVGHQASGANEGLAHALYFYKRWTGYVDDRDSRARVSRTLSFFITRFVDSLVYRYSADEGWTCDVDEKMQKVLEFLQSLTRKHVIDGESVAVTQVGHRRVVRRLFRMFFSAIVHDDARVFPALFRDDATKLSDEFASSPRVRARVGRELRTRLFGPAPRWDAKTAHLARKAGRLSADCVASLTDARALALYARMNGMPPVDAIHGRQR